MYGSVVEDVSPIITGPMFRLVSKTWIVTKRYMLQEGCILAVIMTNSSIACSTEDSICLRK